MKRLWSLLLLCLLVSEHCFSETLTDTKEIEGSSEISNEETDNDPPRKVIDNNLNKKPGKYETILKSF